MHFSSIAVIVFAFLTMAVLTPAAPVANPLKDDINLIKLTLTGDVTVEKAAIDTKVEADAIIHLPIIN